MQGTSSKRKNQTIGKLFLRMLNSTVNFAVLTIFLALFTVGIFALWDSNNLYQGAVAEQYEQYRPTKGEENLSFAQLQRINPEVFGWLNVYGTTIDYPLLQADNNEKYVNTDSAGEYSLAGSIFLDYRNNQDFRDFNNIIYGHHLAASAMFGDIDHFKEEKYFNSHLYGNLYFEGEDHGLEFFALLLVDAYDGTIYIPPVAGEEARQAYLENLKAKSVHYREIGLSTEDRLVLLNTCTSDATNGRHILAARITDEVYEDTLKEKTGTGLMERIGIDAQSIRKQLEKLPIWVWILLAILCILLVAVIYDRVRKRFRKSGSNEDRSEKRKGERTENDG